MPRRDLAEAVEDEERLNRRAPLERIGDAGVFADGCGNVTAHQHFVTAPKAFRTPTWPDRNASFANLRCIS